MSKIAFSDQFKPSFGFPYPPLPTMEEMKLWDIDRIKKYKEARDQVVLNAERNPIGFGFTLPMWQEVMNNWDKYTTHVILGGNRSGKSTFAARLATWAACTIPQAEVRGYQVNKVKSVDEMQRYIWESIPHATKNLQSKKGQNHSIQFSQKNGFTDDICIFPPLPGHQRGGYIRFSNYAQYSDDPNTAEGFKTHLTWLDEECPPALFDTLLYRSIDFHGRILLTFTTIQGYTPLVQKILGKTKTIKSAYAPLLGREIPIIQESLSNPDTCIYYFWTEHNSFLGDDSFIQKLKSRPRDEILARAYGIPTKSVSGAFPTFSRDVNVVKHEDLPFVKDPKYPVTRYMAIDPAGKKNWFVAWVAIDSAGTWWVYREWPDYDDWALPGPTVEGKTGPAQKGVGKGIKGYVELILGLEEGEPIYERLIDPRLGAAERQSADGATTIISDLDDADFIVMAAPGVDIENGLQLLQNKMAYDDTQPRSSVNAPSFYVSDRCANIIYALGEYTGRGGTTEATKDPIDCLRYIAVSDAQFVETPKADSNLIYGKTGGY